MFALVLNMSFLDLKEHIKKKKKIKNVVYSK